MTTYKWQLFKGSKKCVCPQCGRRTFVPFVLAADNATPAGPEFGRCDRESKCGYFRAPGDNRPVVSTTPPPPPAPAIRFTDKHVLKPKRSNLYTFAEICLGDLAARWAWQNYFIGADRYGRVIWWQIDRQGEVRTGKIMAYGNDGHRLHTPGANNWAHRVPEFFGKYTGARLEQCLFGEHLLQPGDNVCVVESEKTAVFMAVLQPQYKWLACGGAQMLKDEARLSALTDCHVTLVPDEGKGWEWAKIAAAHGYDCNLICEQEPTAPGCDILDLMMQ